MCCKKLGSDELSSWKIILLHYLKPVGGKLILCCNYDLKKLLIKIPSFYEDCLKGYSTPYFDFCSKCSICSIKTYERQKEREKKILTAENGARKAKFRPIRGPEVKLTIS